MPCFSEMVCNNHDGSLVRPIHFPQQSAICPYYSTCSYCCCWVLLVVLCARTDQSHDGESILSLIVPAASVMVLWGKWIKGGPSLRASASIPPCFVYQVNLSLDPTFGNKNAVPTRKTTFLAEILLSKQSFFDGFLAVKKIALPPASIPPCFVHQTEFVEVCT